MPSQPHPTTLTETQLLRDSDTVRTRGSGPGGQHRNKVETAIVITHRPTGVSGQASERRSQQANRIVALARLRVNLAVQVRGPSDVQRVPSELWRGRVKAGKVVVSPSHDDFATLLAEALDFVHAQDHDMAAAAQRLQVSTSQLIKLIKLEPAAFQSVNLEREQRNLHRLK